MVVRNVSFFGIILGVFCGCGKAKTTVVAPREVRCTFPSKKILIEGEDKAKVIARWGKPEEIRKNPFGDCKDCFSHFSVFPPFDELWLYTVPPYIHDRGVFFQNGVVVFCLEDESDF